MCIEPFCLLFFISTSFESVYRAQVLECNPLTLGGGGGGKSEGGSESDKALSLVYVHSVQTRKDGNCTRTACSRD